jgi:uncharacterized membrane protein HdeD (DUF308 family)
MERKRLKKNFFWGFSDRFLCAAIFIAAALNSCRQNNLFGIFFCCWGCFSFSLENKNFLCFSPLKRNK